jgi:hypothetical protein
MSFFHQHHQPLYLPLGTLTQLSYLYSPMLQHHVRTEVRNNLERKKSYAASHQKAVSKGLC